jgi:hypothetical protein
VFSESWISLFDVGNEVFNSFNIGLLFALSLLFILFFHFSSDPAISSISGVPLFNPDKGLISGEIIPILIKFEHLFFNGRGISKTFKFPKLFLNIFSRIIGFSLFCFYFFEDIPIDCEEALSIISISFEAIGGKVGPNIESKAILFKIFLAHLIFIEENFLSVVVIPCPFVGIREDVVGFVDLYKPLFGALAGVFIRMAFKCHFTIALLDFSRSGFAVDIEDLVVTPLHFNF